MRTAVAKRVAAVAAASAIWIGFSPVLPASAQSGINRNATLRIAQNVSATNWDPHKLSGAVAAAHAFVMYPYDQLVEYGPNLKPKPMLASSWSVAPDGKSMTFNLRQDVTFQDGTKFDASVVRANLLRAKAAPAFAAALSTLKAVTVVRPYVARVDFSAKTYNFADFLAQDVRVASMINPKKFDDPNLARVPAGTGPYRLVSSSTQKTTFERVAKHWDTTSGLAKRIEIRTVLDANARLNALRSGQVDAAYTTLDQVDEAKAAKIKLNAFKDTTAVQGVLMNYNSPRLRDWRIRKAISLALDRQAIINTAFGGYCRNTQQIFSKLSGGFVAAEDTPAALRQNREAAQRLLDQAGVKSLNLSGLIPGGNTSLALFAQMTQAQLEPLGIKVRLTTQPSAQSTISFADGQFDLSWTSTNGSPESQAVIEGNLKNRGKGFGVPDYIQSAVERASRLPYGPQRDKAWEKVGQELVDRPTHVMVCNNHAYFGISPKLVGMQNIAYGRLTQGIFEARRIGITR